MPIEIPSRTPAEDPADVATVQYWSAAEVADLFHVSANTVRRRCQTHEWPHLRLPTSSGRGRWSYWLSAEDIAAVVELLHVDPLPGVLLPEEPPPPAPRLGLVMDEADAEEIGG